MKRLFLLIGAAGCLALPLGDLAMAQGRGHEGRGHEERADGGGRAERRAGPEGRGSPDRYRSERGPSGRRFDDRRALPQRGEWNDDGRRDRWDDRDRGPREESRRRYEDRRPRAFAPSEARRGGYLPDRFRGGVVEDYRRYRLRPPPHGYAWVRVGAGFALVSEASGQVFDIIPD